MARKPRPPKPPTPPPPPVPSGGAVVLGWQVPGPLDNLRTLHTLGATDDATAAKHFPIVLSYLQWATLRGTAMANGMYQDPKGDDDGTRALHDALSFDRRHGIRVAMNVTGGGRAQCDGRADLLTRDLAQVRRVLNLGFTIDRFDFQSVVSGTVHTEQCMQLYPKAGGMARRIQDVERAGYALLALCPTAGIGLADTAMAKEDNEHNAPWDYRRDYTLLTEGMVRAGLPIPSFHMAIAKEEGGPNLDKIVAAAQFFRANHFEWWLKPISDSASQSAAVFARDLIAFVADMQRYDCLPFGLNGTSWNRAFPTAIYPEATVGTLFSAMLGWINLGVIQSRA